ncbi:MAG: tetratricopeptide repeat protein [Ekhidna sp.]
MKKSLLTIVSLLGIFTLLASDSIAKQLKHNVTIVNNSDKRKELDKAAQQLKETAAKNPDLWQPLYYSALGYIKLFAFEKKKEGKDAQLDKADVSIKQLLEMNPENSEVVTLHAYSLIMRLTVDPTNRGMDYSGEIFDNLLKAIRLDSNNPRAHFLMGRMKIGTAQFMGTGYGNACENLNKAHQIFEKGETLEDEFFPSWGKEPTAEVVNSYCKG